MKLQVTMDFFGYGMQKRIATSMLKDGEHIEPKIEELKRDGALISLEVKIPKKEEPKKKEVKKEKKKSVVKKVVKKVKKIIKKKK